MGKRRWKHKMAALEALQKVWKCNHHLERAGLISAADQTWCLVQPCEKWDCKLVWQRSWNLPSLSSFPGNQNRTWLLESTWCYWKYLSLQMFVCCHLCDISRLEKPRAFRVKWHANHILLKATLLWSAEQCGSSVVFLKLLLFFQLFNFFSFHFVLPFTSFFLFSFHQDARFTSTIENSCLPSFAMV